MASGLRLGAFPAKVTVPVIDEAANATPGPIAAATNPAARHNLYTVLRILLPPSSSQALPSARHRRGRRSP
jgi:hypothetical protein